MRNLFPSVSEEEFGIVITALQAHEKTYEVFLDQHPDPLDQEAAKAGLTKIRDLLGHLMDECFGG